MVNKIYNVCHSVSMWLLLTVILFGVTSCGQKETPKATLYRLDKELSIGIMPEDSVARSAAERLFEISGFPSLTNESLAEYAAKPSIYEHIKGVEREFVDTEREEVALGEIFAAMGEQLPEINIPDVYTIISPFSQSVLVADSLLYIGLNHYLGADYEYYGYFPDYIRRLKERERISLDVTEAIIRISYPFQPGSEYPQAVQSLAYEGAVAVAMECLTGASTDEVLGYDPIQYKWLEDNEGQMWRALAERQLLFSTDRSVIRSLIEVAPHTSVLSTDAPGRAGRYVGRKLIGAYMDKNGKLSLDQLLSPDFYTDPSLLPNAGYYP